MELSKSVKITSGALLVGVGAIGGVLIAHGGGHGAQPVTVQQVAAVSSAAPTHTAAAHKAKPKARAVKPADQSASSVVVKKAAPKVAAVQPQQQEEPVTQPSDDQTTPAPVVVSTDPTTEAPIITEVPVTAASDGRAGNAPVMGGPATPSSVNLDLPTPTPSPSN